MSSVPPLPYGDPIGTWTAPNKKKIPVNVTDSWERSLSAFTDHVTNTAVQLAAVQLTEQSASIAATAIPISNVTTGIYRLSYYARISRAAGTSSSLTVTLQWTDGGVVCSTSGAAMTGNTTTTFQTGHLLLGIDSATSVRYSTTYASAGAPTMQYKLTWIVEQVG